MPNIDLNNVNGIKISLDDNLILLSSFYGSIGFRDGNGDSSLPNCNHICNGYGTGKGDGRQNGNGGFKNTPGDGFGDGEDLGKFHTNSY